MSLCPKPAAAAAATFFFFFSFERREKNRPSSDALPSSLEVVGKRKNKLLFFLPFPLSFSPNERTRRGQKERSSEQHQEAERFGRGETLPSRGHFFVFCFLRWFPNLALSTGGGREKGKPERKREKIRFSLFLRFKLPKCCLAPLSREKTRSRRKQEREKGRAAARNPLTFPLRGRRDGKRKKRERK